MLILVDASCLYTLCKLIDTQKHFQINLVSSANNFTSLQASEAQDAAGSRTTHMLPHTFVWSNNTNSEALVILFMM
jgi:hypothetical protein